MTFGSSSTGKVPWDPNLCDVIREWGVVGGRTEALEGRGGPAK